MFSDIFFSDIKLGLKQFDVFINGKKNVFILNLKFLVDFPEPGIDLFQITNHGFFLESQTVKSTVEFLFLQKQVLIMQEQMFFLSAYIKSFVFWDCVITG